MIKLENLSKVYRTEEIESTALNQVSFQIEKGEFVSVMGPSGCGKSTLINDVLYKNMYNKFNPEFTMKAGKVKEIIGTESFKKVIDIDQKSIGRTPRSNPATYVGVFDDIRDLFANLPESKLPTVPKPACCVTPDLCAAVC